jgi:opacity protein-like surface antigen
MKKALGLSAAMAISLAAAANGHAAVIDNFYSELDAGAAFQENMATKEGTGFGGPSANVKFDTGWRVDAGVGYVFCPYFSAEFDSGVIWNSINTVGIQPLSPVGASAHLAQVPLLVNGVFTCPLGDFHPYVGLGIGGVIGIFESSSIPLSGPGANPGYGDTDFTFGYQFEAGLKYSVSQRADLGLAYKFLGTTEHQWRDNNIDLKTDGTLSHGVMATFTWHF